MYQTLQVMVLNLKVAKRDLEYMKRRVNQFMYTEKGAYCNVVRGGCKNTIKSEMKISVHRCRETWVFKEKILERSKFNQRQMLSFTQRQELANKQEQQTVECCRTLVLINVVV